MKKENLSGSEKLETGTIKSDGKTYLSIICGEGEIFLEELQLAGKKRMLVKDLLAGFRNPESHRFL